MHRKDFPVLPQFWFVVVVGVFLRLLGAEMGDNFGSWIGDWIADNFNA